MLFIPKASKFQKLQKGIFPNKLKNNSGFKNYRSLRSLKLVTSSFGFITSKQMTAVRFLIRKFIKKRGLLIFRVFPQKAVTKKPQEIRMGKGKGSVAFWAANLKYGTTICDIYYKLDYKKNLLKLLKRVQIRLPLKTKIC